MVMRTTMVVIYDGILLPCKMIMAYKKKNNNDNAEIQNKG